MIGEKENAKIISLLKAPFENTTKKKASAEGCKFALIKRSNKNIDKHDLMQLLQ